MLARRVFDEAHYDFLNKSRARVVSDFVTSVRTEVNLRTAIDVGCGLGYFSDFLSSLQLQTTAVDGREENVEEAQRRFPHATFLTMNAEDRALQAVGQFDLVFCFGLLYHLENPFQTVRNLYALTSQVSLIESVIYPGSEPLMALVDEESHGDQGLHHIAFYPTESCLIKMLYRAGFPFVYRLAVKPEHPDFQPPPHLRQVRVMLAASLSRLNCARLIPISEPESVIRPWDATSGTRDRGAIGILQRFVRKPLPAKVLAIRRLLAGRSL